MTTDNPDDKRLTDEERRALLAVAHAWDLVSGLDWSHPDDIPEIRKAFHDIQVRLAIRVARRCDPNVWECGLDYVGPC